MTDYIVPEVTHAEASFAARQVIADGAPSPILVARIGSILAKDREHVASLQDPWVEVPSGAMIPEGVRYRVEEGKSAHEYVSSNEWLIVDTGTYTAFVRRSDLPKVILPKSRRERIIDEVMKGDLWPNEPMLRSTVGEWVDMIVTAVKAVDDNE